MQTKETRPRYARAVFLPLLVLLGMTRPGFGQTNFYPLLCCKNRTYTNVTFGAVTPATISLLWDGGGERVAIINLPADAQAALHYDPAAAQAYLDSEAHKKARYAEQALETSQAIAQAKASLGPEETVRIISLVSAYRVRIIAEDGMLQNAYIHNLPQEVLNFVGDYNDTKAKVDADKYTDYNDLYGYTRQDQKMASLRHFQEIASQLKERSTVIAQPSAYIGPGGVPQWEYVGTPGRESARWRHPVAPPSQQLTISAAPSQQIRDGIPSDVFDRIVADAERRHPGDYSTQKYVIETQVEDYKALHSEH